MTKKETAKFVIQVIVSIAKKCSGFLFQNTLSLIFIIVISFIYQEMPML